MRSEHGYVIAALISLNFYKIKNLKLKKQKITSFCCCCLFSVICRVWQNRMANEMSVKAHTMTELNKIEKYLYIAQNVR